MTAGVPETAAGGAIVRLVVRRLVWICICAPFMASIVAVYVGMPMEVVFGGVDGDIKFWVYLALVGLGFLFWLISALGELWTEVDRIRRPERHKPAPRPVAEPYPVVEGDRPLVGWRRWILLPEEGPTPTDAIPVLAGPVMKTPWLGPEYVATCRSGHGSSGAQGDHLPVSRCRCGIYALKKLDPPGPGLIGVLVEGRVSMSGRVLEAERGYRAQQARIVGPLRLVLRCSHNGAASPCAGKPSHVTVDSGAYRVTCAAHRLPGDKRGRPAVEFIEDTARWLQARYGVETKTKEVTPWTSEGSSGSTR